MEQVPAHEQRHDGQLHPGGLVQQRPGRRLVGSDETGDFAILTQQRVGTAAERRQPFGIGAHSRRKA